VRQGVTRFSFESLALGIALLVAFGALAAPGSRVRLAVTDQVRAATESIWVKANWKSLRLLGQPLGAPTRSEAVLEFADYQCPYCRRMAPLVDSLARAGTLNVRLIHVPIARHRAASGAARAAVCSEAQGRFAQVHRWLMSDSAWMRDTNWVAVATAAGVPNLAEFDRCLGSERTITRLVRDDSVARRLGVRATPTFVSRSSRLVGLISIKDLVKLGARK
jgi:protein-disulfide isomerase